MCQSQYYHDYIIQMSQNYFSGEHYQKYPTLQSIDAHSEYSVDLKPNEMQPLLSKIFMLCIELEHKDRIIQEIERNARQGQLKKSQIDFSHIQLSKRYEKLELDFRSVIEQNAVIKNENHSLIKNLSEMETLKNHSIFNRQLEEKVRKLEIKLRKTEEQNIELVQREKNLKRQVSMLSFNLAKTSQKNRIRDLEHDLAQEKQKLETEKRLTFEQKSFIEKYSSDIKELKEKLVRQQREFQQKIQYVKARQDLKSSKISMQGEQKVALMAQQMNRLKQEIDHLRRQNYEDKSLISQRDEEVFKLNEDLKGMQRDIQHLQQNLRSMQNQFQKREEHLLMQLQKFEGENKNLHNTCGELDYYLKQKSMEDGEKRKQIQRLKEQIQQFQSQKLVLKTQIRKVKRQSLNKNIGECEICKARASMTSIPSGKRLSELMSPVDFEQIIKETEKLKQSNKKIQTLISHHEISSQHSIEQRQSFTRMEQVQIMDMSRT